jgi:membrane protein implicated in regulation of membrane protease activity
MSNHNINWLIIVVVLASLAAIGGFVYLILPNIDSPAVAGLAGVVVGAFVGMFGSILTAIVGAWRTSKETEERLKDRVSNHALQLTQMDYDLRQKSFELTGKTKKVLAPVKVYRTFYRALLELQTSGTWPKEVEKLGLLQIFELGAPKEPKKSLEETR